MQTCSPSQFRDFWAHGSQQSRGPCWRMGRLSYLHHHDRRRRRQRTGQPPQFIKSLLIVQQREQFRYANANQRRDEVTTEKCPRLSQR